LLHVLRNIRIELIEASSPVGVPHSTVADRQFSATGEPK
jgi:hypothetical protein